MDGFIRRREQKKEAIRRAALELFQGHGISRVSLADIAGKADVSPVSIYNHFGSKQGLIRDVVKWYLDRTVERYKAILDDHRPFMQKIEAIIFDKQNIMRSYSAEFIQAIISQDPEIKSYFETVYQEMVASVAALLEQGKREGMINPELSTETVLLYFDVLTKGITANSAIFNNPVHNQKILEQFSQIYLYGLVGGPNRNRP